MLRGGRGLSLPTILRSLILRSLDRTLHDAYNSDPKPGDIAIVASRRASGDGYVAWQGVALFKGSQLTILEVTVSCINCPLTGGLSRGRNPSHKPFAPLRSLRSYLLSVITRGLFLPRNLYVVIQERSPYDEQRGTKLESIGTP